MKTSYSIVAILLLIVSTGFDFRPKAKNHHRTITRFTRMEKGMEIPITIVLLDKHTTREDVIRACALLAKENVQLTFDELVIGRSVFGLIGKTRLTEVVGKVSLPNGEVQSFKAGGLLPFRSVRI